MNGRNGPKLDADLLTVGEIELLMRQCSRRAPTGVRNRALIAVLWRCGLRIGEARGLAVKDLDPDAGTLVIQRGKGGKRRVVGVDSGTIALIGRWLERRRQLGIRPAAPRSSAHSRGSPSTCRTSGTCFRGSRARRASSAVSTPTGYATRSQSTSSARARPSTSCATPSATRASRRLRSTSAASAPTRRSTR